MVTAVARRLDLSNTILEQRYMLARQIGVGSVGAVYEALDIESRDERVAIKVLHVDLVRNDATVARFKREARAMAKLRHPNVVDMRRLVVVPQMLPFMVMEYVDGETLHEFLKRARRITPHHATRIALQVLSALQVAHREGVVHRDLRPDNIFLVPSASEDENVKVADFGAAKLLSESTDRPLTITGMLIGTMAFMPPEQALAKAVDARADLYALAATMYLAISGHNPIEAPTPAALVDAIQNQEPRSLRSLNVDVDDEFEAILRRALQKDPAARFQSARAMARALQTWMTHVAPEARASRDDGDADDDTKPFNTLDGIAAPRPRSRANARVGMPAAGRMFEHYEVVGLLGTGGVGEVYHAKDTHIGGRSVALKVLRVARDTTQSGLTIAGANRIVHEARAAAKIVHPNVVTVFNVGQREDLPYLVMELIAGQTLRQYIGDPCIPIERRVGWILDIAYALAAAHMKNVIHQDVKPENVMVRDEDGAIKVLDFGIARRVFEQDIFVRSEATERVPGTPAYMAPEQMHGEDGGPLTDQFAWAVLAYEVLAGSLPWVQRGGFIYLVDQILTRVPEAPSRRRRDVPEEVERVVLKALAKRPEDRFASMDAVAIALRAAWAESQAPMKRTGAFAALDALPVVEAPGAVTNADADEAAPANGATGGLARWGLRSRRRLVGGLAAAALAVGLGVLVPRATSTTVQSAAPAASTTATETTAPDAESTMSANADATAAYRTGLEAVHNAAGGTARKSFDQALKLDPSFAAAHLRRMTSTAEVSDAERENLRMAVRLRSALNDHDRALLHAVEPWFDIPQDVTEVERRLAALTAVRPDADYLYQLCRFRVLGGDYIPALQSCSAARTLDSTFAGAIWLEGQSRLFLNDAKAGRAALDECLRVSPKATACINDIFWLESHDGACDSALRDAQRLVGLEPESSRWLEQLGAATYSMDKPLANARALLERSVELTPTRRMPFVRAWTRVNLAVLGGDFEEARSQLGALDQVVDASDDEWIHSDAFRTRSLFLRETGQEAAAISRARTFLASHAAWSPSPDNDGSIDAWIALYRGGAVTRQEFAATRADWLAREQTRPRAAGRIGTGPGRLWVRAYADAVLTADDAREAIAALPHYLPLPPDRFRDTEDDEAIGRAFLLAGRASEAIPFLRRAASSCEAPRYPFHHTWANLELGEALEPSDVPAACAAYQVVFDRWAIVPTSTSAHAAYARRKSLGCR